MISVEKADQFAAKFKLLQESEPNFKSTFLGKVVYGPLDSLFWFLLKVCFNQQHDRESIEVQHLRGKYIRLMCDTFDLPGVAEALTSAEKCEGACGNHVYMLVRGDKSLCYHCWDDLVTPILGAMLPKASAFVVGKP
jgi:hypothetical protein